MNKAHMWTTLDAVDGREEWRQGGIPEVDTLVVGEEADTLGIELAKGMLQLGDTGVGVAISSVPYDWILTKTLTLA